jgi:hypothetical protein
MSALTYDMLEKSVTIFFYQPKTNAVVQKSYFKRFGGGFLWLCSRIGYHGVSLIARSTGLAIGTFISGGNVAWGGNIGAMLLESAIISQLSHFI